MHRDLHWKINEFSLLVKGLLEVRLIGKIGIGKFFSSFCFQKRNSGKVIFLLIACFVTFEFVFYSH